MNSNKNTFSRYSQLLQQPHHPLTPVSQAQEQEQVQVQVQVQQTSWMKKTNPKKTSFATSSFSCDEYCLEAIQRQLTIQERLHDRYTCGELSHNNMFCHHIEHMRKTRSSLFKQLEQMTTKMHMQMDVQTP